MIENIIKKMELIEANIYELLDFSSKTEPEYEFSQRIKLNEFFRNDLMVLIIGYSFALIVFIIEIMFLYLYQSKYGLNRNHRLKTHYNWIKLKRPRPNVISNVKLSRYHNYW